MSTCSSVDGKKREPSDVFRVISAVKLSVLAGSGGTAETAFLANEEWDD